MCDRTSTREQPPQTDLDLGLGGLSLEDVGESTRIVSASHVFTGTPSTPVVPPIYHASTYILEKPEDLMKCVKDGGACYQRLGNPTSEALDAAVNVIERGVGSLTFASGMAGISSVLTCFLNQGDHVIIQIPCYPGTMTYLNIISESFGVEITKIKDAVFEDVTKAVKPNTKMIWIETPCNPEIVVVDVRQMAEFTRSKDILLAVDGTFASPYVQRVIEMGADFSIQSSTKYMGGHSDLLGGSVTTRTLDQWRRLKFMQSMLGNSLNPHECSLLHRSLRTLPIRMERTSETALKVATFLEQHPKVERVRYPGLASHPQHHIAAKQMRLYSGMIMADVKGGGAGGKAVAENIKIFKMAVSLGGVESLLEHPYSMTHGPFIFTDAEREEACITPGMLRISIGLEDPEDLIRDLDQALAKVIV